MKASQYMVKSGLMSMMKYIKFVSSIGFVVTVIIGTMIYIFSSEILFFFYGNKYAGLDYYVALWVLVYPFIYLGFPIRIAFRSMERTRDIFVSYLIAGSISIMIGPALIRHKGIEGALFGIIISYATIVIFLYVKLVRNVRKISTH
jgi:O-antigen/teichoic acid export membrane protein